MEHYRTELALIKTSLWGKECYPLEKKGDEDWESVFVEMKAQSIAGITAEALDLVPEMNPGTRRTWIQFVVRQMAFWNKLMREQDSLKSLLDREGIPFVVLKGAAAAMYYTQPESRTMGDVDLIVRPEDFERTDQILRENGYEWVEENDRHSGFSKNGVHFELHRYFATFNDLKKARELDAMIYKGIENRVYITMGQYSVPVLPKLENGVVLLAHIDQHLERGLGLRQIVDWMLYVDQNLHDDYWTQEFGLWIKRLEKETLAVTVTRMCQLYLGLREERISWCLTANEDLCCDLMKMTITQGNFGQKTGISTSVISLFGFSANVLGVLRMLQTKGCLNWKALKKYSFLRPFAWLYQLCRYVRKVMSFGYSPGQLIADMRQVESSQQLFDQLGVRQQRVFIEQSEKKHRG